MWDLFGASGSNVTSWKSGPDERGTFNILSTCVITLILCVYNCLHLNIPGPDQKTWWKLFQRKFLWLMAGLFAPEFVAFVAFFDWLLAKNLEVEMRKLLDPLMKDAFDSISDAEGRPHPDQSTTRLSDRSTRKGLSRRHRWTRTHSHFAHMGGYAFDMTAFPINFAPNQVRSLTLTACGLKDLAERDSYLIPDISREEILDKSKADGFSKILVCLQALWFAIQCIGRLAAHHPISLLELNTFLHAICCLVIYAAWWHKPLDIDTPCYVESFKENAELTCAWMIAHSSIRPNKVVWSRTTNAQKKPDSGLLSNKSSFTPCVFPGNKEVGEQITVEIADHFWEAKSSASKTKLLAQLAYPEVPTTEDKDSNFWRLYEDQRFGCYLCWAMNPGWIWDKAHFSYRHLNRTELECYKHTQHRHEQLGPLQQEIPIFRDMLIHRAPSFYPLAYGYAGWPDGWRQRLGISTMLNPLDVYSSGAAFASAVYGSIHLSAWHNHFSTYAESIIWRVCCFILISPLVLVLAPLASYVRRKIVGTYLRPSAFPENVHSCPKLSKNRPDLLKRTIHILTRSPLLYRVRLCLCIFYATSYVAARIFLIVESFRNLGHMPEAVYKQPDWSIYLPHLGSG
ncbi:hypothetical protein FB567DRAFT_600548 [Paraphoma chrysanthemicola]|uniref:Uncharacterized protein n=1 Tax=Paraphoma chrysanthemicola TaxID=798071 RepID=A0A8K0W564_9PLEO|nr:hypothetical protein FB567DRAFT_600548 [Paraphoma chrysanthemicola]